MIVVYGYNAASHSLGVALHSGSDIFWVAIYLQYTVYLIQYPVPGAAPGAAHAAGNHDCLNA